MSTTKKKTPPAHKGKKKKVNKKKRVTLVAVVALIACAAAIIILYVSGVIRFEKVETVVNNRTGIAYVSSADAEMIINSDGRVLEAAEATPEDIPHLTGIEFTRIQEGERLEYETPEAFEYAVKLIMALRVNEIAVREVNINADYEATAYVNNITILFGPDNKTEIKAADLADFYDQVKDLKGTLHMEEVNEKLGYTFKQESENTAIIEEATKPTEEETTEEGAEENVEEVWNEEQYYEEPVYEEEYYEEPVNEEYYEEPVEEYYEEPVYEEYYEEPVYEEEQW